MNKSILLLLCILICIPYIYADKVYNRNKKGNKLYAAGNYAEALSQYEEALTESSKDKKVLMNKGSALLKLGQLDKAEETYKKAEAGDDRNAQADLLYNKGNLYNLQADKLASEGNQQAMDKLKSARDSYIKSLNIRPSDNDAKWNLEITQQKIKMLEKQQKNQQNQQNNKENNVEPSEHAKKIKAQADKLVSERQYKKAFDLMVKLLSEDKTAVSYQDYTKRLKDVTDIQ